MPFFFDDENEKEREHQMSQWKITHKPPPTPAVNATAEDVFLCKSSPKWSGIPTNAGRAPSRSL